jgi:hypothetical protein
MIPKCLFNYHQFFRAARQAALKKPNLPLVDPYSRAKATLGQASHCTGGSELAVIDEVSHGHVSNE